MWGGEALKRLASAVGLRRTRPPTANSIRFKSVVCDPCSSLSSARTSTANVHFRNFSHPSLQHIVYPLEPEIQRLPIPADEPVPIELVARYLAYHVYENVILKKWMAFQILFAQIDLDIGVRQFAGCWIYMCLSRLVGAPRLDVHPDVVVVGNVGGGPWFTWLFGPNVDEAQVALEMQNPDDSDDITLVTLYLAVFPIVIVIFFKISATATFQTFMWGTFGFVTGDRIFTFMPVWVRIMFLLFSLFTSVTHGLAQQIVNWTWIAVKNYMWKKVAEFNISLSGQRKPSRPVTLWGGVLHVIDIWMTHTSVAATWMVQLLPASVLAYLHIGFVTSVVQVLVGYYFVAAFFLLLHMLLCIFTGWAVF